MTPVRRSSLRLAALAAALLFVACDGLLSGGPARSPLDGLSYIASADSAGNIPPDPPTGETTPGYVRGTVLGPWDGAGSSNDSLANAPRIAGVTVGAYELPAGGVVTPENVGALVASAVTDADGKFTLPTMEGGQYAVTFTPPAGSIYGGVWVLATVHETSHEFPWWVVLWKK